MEEKFKQKQEYLDADNSTGKIKIEKLCSLIENHPYKEAIYKMFDVESIKNEFIAIEFIDLIYKKINHFITNYNRYKVLAETKDINVYEESVSGSSDTNIIFNFEEYVDIDEVKENLKAIALYDSKNTFLDEYAMTKYANNLFKIGQASLANYNVQYFKEMAKNSDGYNKERSYRLVDHKDVTYLRGITSSRYYEYGIDFTFVVGMLSLYKNMKANLGIEYKITSAAISESKLEIIVSERHTKDAGKFGQVSTAVKITTNDLGTGSLNFVNVINVMQKDSTGFYLIPKKDSMIENSSLVINHNTKPENVFVLLKEMDGILNTTDNFIAELNSVKAIKNPDELRVKILSKIQSPRSSFKSITKLSDIFNRKIDNEVSNFKKLLVMCNKAEELHLDYDLKDKLRYIISDVILYGNYRDN
ncbi:hypothetical protein [Maribacter sp. HTCC2170]|uniref:hypothetical protein n=1 Tax=Maribacter sp. (strain HTCC2170 / KCCM 42371) TaxID=313603 RepID=UPI00006AFCAD|nr:hypothetical protein [Maribacter sp. HTCC2170]EAR01405.1 hypothetical protein FB2170_11811 [Maribacter sp. HTCC2170]